MGTLNRFSHTEEARKITNEETLPPHMAKSLGGRERASDSPAYTVERGTVNLYGECDCVDRGIAYTAIGYRVLGHWEWKLLYFLFCY